MNIGVLLKQVPDTDTRIEIKPDGTGIEDGEVKWVINPYDEYAVEEALCLKEKAGGEVVVVTVGLTPSLDSLRQAVAMGADRGILIDTTGVTIDPYLTSLLISKTVSNEQFNIIFAGKQSTDHGFGQVHIGVAQKLGWSHCSPVTKFEVCEDWKNVRLTRPIGGGKREIIRAKLPIVIGCEKGLNKPRYATLSGIIKAKSKPVAMFCAGDLLGGEEARLSIRSYSPIPKRGGVKMIGGEPASVAEELVRLLREEARVI